MHRVLQIPEVLLNIFYQLLPSGSSEVARNNADCDLAALARTCRAFKEPALDTLWSELNDPSPLSRCLPEVSCQKFISFLDRTRSPLRFRIARKTCPSTYKEVYSFSRPLERAEWDILCSYARRIRCMHDFETTFDWKSVITSVCFTPVDLLLPNLRSLHCDFANETIPLLQLALPSLIRLHIKLSSMVDPLMLQDSLMSLAKTSPNIKRLSILGSQCKRKSAEIISNGICGWSNLHSVTCPRIPLDMDTLVHLSRMPSLAQLSSMLDGTLSHSTTFSKSLFFPVLNHLKLHAESLALIWGPLSWIEVTAITDFTVTVSDCPSEQDFDSFMAAVLSFGGLTIQEFNLNQVLDNPDTAESRGPNVPLFDVNGLRPCMAFHHLRHLNIDLEWDVGLSDEELLTLASAWPRLEELLINTNWGWNRPGITPNGLAQLLEACPSLTSIALAIDTRECTQMSARRFREPVNPSSFDRPFRINVLDSVIQRESVDAMATFFTRTVPHFDLTLIAWEAWSVSDHPDLDLYREYWADVHSQASERIKKRWLNVLRELFFPS